MAYIYKIINDINDKIYIGKTTNTIQKRWKQHCSDSQKENIQHRPLYKAIKKYGIEHFHIEEVEECSIEKIDEREKYWIEYYSSFKNGYNATIGGDGKVYLDYDLIVQNYKILQNQAEVAKIMNISIDSVKIALDNKKVQIRTSQEVNKNKYGKVVSAFDKKTKSFVKSFASYHEAARWLIDNNLTNCKLGTIQTHISEVVRGKRKSAAGFIWKGED